MTKFVAFLATFVAVVAATAVPPEVRYSPRSEEYSNCIAGTEILSEFTHDGRTVQKVTCKTHESLLKPRNSIFGRDSDICGAPCTTYCNSGTGGPNPFDCSSLASALASNSNDEFTIASGYTNYYSYQSCSAFIVNRESSTVIYCYDNNNFAGVINYLAFNCQASTSGGPYLGGSCHFYDQTNVFAQVQTS